MAFHLEECSPPVWTKPNNKLCFFIYSFVYLFFVVVISNWFAICSISTIFHFSFISCNAIFSVYHLLADAAL